MRQPAARSLRSMKRLRVKRSEVTAVLFGIAEKGALEQAGADV